MEILKKHKSAFGFLMLISVLLTTGYVMAGTEMEYSIEYYSGFSGYQHPVRPDHKISKEEAKTHKAYCVAYFDKDRKLMKFVKFFEGSRFLEYSYEYYPSGTILRADVKNKDGVATVLEFDETGKLRE